MCRIRENTHFCPYFIINSDTKCVQTLIVSKNHSCDITQKKLTKFHDNISTRWLSSYLFNNIELNLFLFGLFITSQHSVGLERTLFITRAQIVWLSYQFSMIIKDRLLQESLWFNLWVYNSTCLLLKTRKKLNVTILRCIFQELCSHHPWDCLTNWI